MSANQNNVDFDWERVQNHNQTIVKVMQEKEDIYLEQIDKQHSILENYLDRQAGIDAVYEHKGKLRGAAMRVQVVLSDMLTIRTRKASGCVTEWDKLKSYDAWDIKPYLYLNYSVPTNTIGVFQIPELVQFIKANSTRFTFAKVNDAEYMKVPYFELLEHRGKWWHTIDVDEVLI